MYFNRCIKLLIYFAINLANGATNWPVFFEHLGHVHSIHNKWDLTLAVDTRIREFEIRYKILINNLLEASLVFFFDKIRSI